MYCIKEIPKEERPRERLKEVGVENITNVELLSIILKTGTKNKNVKELSIDILNTYDMSDLKDISINALKKIKGIGEVKAIELISAIELGKRILLKEPKVLEKLDNPKEIWESSRYLLSDKKQEYFYCLYFDNKQRLIERKLLFMGTINRSVTHMREIFKEAYQVSASSIVCLHNHPSNDITPSPEDIKFTRNLFKTGELQGIPVVDHIIIGDDNYYSFYEHISILNL